MVALVASVQLPHVSDSEFDASLTELRELAKTLGYKVVETFVQKRASFDTTGYLGIGKRQEIAEFASHTSDVEIDALLVDHEISPSQARNLEKESGCPVMDRTMVILEIFHRNARSRAAKLQVDAGLNTSRLDRSDNGAANERSQGFNIGLRWQPTHDPLTGLANRLQMAQTLEKILTAPNREHRACVVARERVVAAPGFRLPDVLTPVADGAVRRLLEPDRGLAERDERLDEAAQLLRLRDGRLDRLVAQQRGRHVAQHRPAMGGVAAQLPPGQSVSHRSLLR